MISLGERHVAPRDDLIEHDTDSDCVCGPRLVVVPVELVSGEVVIGDAQCHVYVHASLDGRELNE